jgi:di- and tripeptidase
MSILGLRSQAGLAPPTPYTGSETEDADFASTPGLLTRQPSQDVGDTQSEQLPTLLHRLRHSNSILALALSDECIYAGTHGGEILVYSLRTYERQAVIEGHRGSVLGLCLSADQKLLFSSGGDRIVNVWKTTDLKRECCLFSSYDVGDIFCVAYSTALKTVYLGAQNTTIQWCSQDQKDTKACPKQRAQTPSFKDDPFFDSRGPGGVRTPRPADADIVPKHAKGGDIIEIGKGNVRHFAHYGYVYCMVLAKTIPEAPGQEILVTGGGDGVVKLWRLDGSNGGAPEEFYQLDDGREEGHSIHSVSVEGTFLYSGRSGGEIDVWDLETRQLIRNLKAHRDDVLTICIGGGFMFSAAVTGYVRKFDRQYQLKSRLRAHEGRILASAFKSYRRRSIYVTGGSDSTLAVWDVSDCVASPLSTMKTTNEQLVDSLAKLVSYRTVSSDPKCALECRRGASYLRSVFKNFGATTEMLSTQHGCNPVILARFKGNPATRSTRKTILFYGHYDVVAAENRSRKWIVDPFAMEGIDGYLYGRGTSDNKGPIMAAIFACAELMSEQALGSDIVFLIEGEEESGSRGFEKAVRENKDKIGEVDWILLSNSYWLDDRIPCLTYGLRGVIHAKVQVESTHPDMHSGVDGSAELDESLKDLVMLLGNLTGKNGEVKIPGFYDPVLPLGDEEKALYEDIANALVHRNPALGDPAALKLSLMRRWREATLTIHRFNTSGPDNASIIPRLAKAAISMRLVPNQEAAKVAEMFKWYLQAEFDKLESNNKLTITIDHQAEPWLGDWRNEIYQMLEAAIMDVWGPMEHTRRRSSALPPKAPISTQTSQEANGNYFTVKSPTTSNVLADGSAEPLELSQSPLSEVTTKLEDLAATTSPKSPTKRHSRDKKSTTFTERKKPLYIREGGSIPAIRFLEKEFGAPAAHFPCGQASDKAHLDNERLRLVNLYKGREVFKRVFRDLPSK